MAQIPINRGYDHAAALKAEEEQAKAEHRKLQLSISERTMTRTDYYAVKHWLRSFYWRVRKLAT